VLISVSLMSAVYRLGGFILQCGAPEEPRTVEMSDGTDPNTLEKETSAAAACQAPHILHVN
jgi:hypothetical protein